MSEEKEDYKTEKDNGQSKLSKWLDCPDCKKEYSRTHLEKQFACRRKDYEWAITYLCDCGKLLSISRQPAIYNITLAD